MSLSHRVLALTGYDPEVVRALGPGSARRLSAIAWATLVPCLLIGGSAGYAAYAVERSWPIALALGGVFALFVLNLLRVSVAGGGMAPRKTLAQVKLFRPAFGPVVVLALLSGLLAQPVLLPVFAAELDPQIEAHRQALLHAQAAVPLPERVRPGSEAHALRTTRAERYARGVAAASFAARRVVLAWRRPLVAGALVALFVVACLLPLWLARGPLVAAVRHYELVRRDRLHILLFALEQQTAAEVERALTRFASYEPNRAAPGRLSFVGAP